MVKQPVRNPSCKPVEVGTGNINALIDQLNSQKGGKKATDAINEWYNSDK